MLLLYADTAAARATTVAQAELELERYTQLTQALADEGVLRGGEAFLPASTGKRVQLGGVGLEVVDVPATQRELSGFFIIECDEARAIEVAGDMPVAEHGQVEVRPLMDLPEPDPTTQGSRSGSAGSGGLRVSGSDPRPAG